MGLKKEVVDVSIVTANYNCGEFIGQYFDSILGSSMLPREIIFVDDGSTDSSLREAYKFSDHEMVKIIHLDENIGFANALNLGINDANCTYIMRLDSDDFIRDNRIEIQYQYLLNHLSVDLIGSNVYYYHHISRRSIQRSNMPLTRDDIYETYKRGDHGIFHTSVMGRADIFRKITFRQEYYPAEDYDFFARALTEEYNIINIPDPLTYYRIHQSNLSFVHLKTSVKKIFEIRLEVFRMNKRFYQFWLNFLHRYFYRKFLLTIRNPFKSIYLILAGLLRIQSVYKRMTNF